MLLQWFRLFTALIIICFAAPTSARASEPAEYGCDRPIRLAFAESGALYHQGIGIDQDVIAAIGARTGCIFETETLPREQIWRLFRQNAIDMTTGSRATREREKFAYLIPYMGMKMVIITDTAIATQIRSFDDILNREDWRIGVVSGFAYGSYYDYRLHGLHAQYRIITYPDQEKLYNGLRHNDVQVILSPSVNYAFYLSLNQEQQNFVMYDASPSLPTPYHLVFDRNRFTPVMINAWMRVIEQMRLDGTLEQIYRRHVPAEMIQFLQTY